MPKRDLYEVLGVPPRAGMGEIKRAYRRIALTVHPDVSERSDLERFREAHEAYEVLSDPDRRHSYDVHLESLRPLAVEPTKFGAPIIVRDTRTLGGSIEESLNSLQPNLFGYRAQSGGPAPRLKVEVILDPTEACFGCEVPFHVTYYVICPRCGGADRWWGECSGCDGRGFLQVARQAVLRIPAECRNFLRAHRRVAGSYPPSPAHRAIL